MKILKFPFFSRRQQQLVVAQPLLSKGLSVAEIPQPLEVFTFNQLEAQANREKGDRAFDEAEIDRGLELLDAARQSNADYIGDSNAAIAMLEGIKEENEILIPKLEADLATQEGQLALRKTAFADLHREFTGHLRRIARGIRMPELGRDCDYQVALVNTLMYQQATVAGVDLDALYGRAHKQPQNKILAGLAKLGDFAGVVVSGIIFGSCLAIMTGQLDFDDRGRLANPLIVALFALIIGPVAVSYMGKALVPAAVRNSFHLRKKGNKSKGMDMFIIIMASALYIVQALIEGFGFVWGISKIIADAIDQGNVVSHVPSVVSFAMGVFVSGVYYLAKMVVTIRDCKVEQEIEDDKANINRFRAAAEKMMHGNEHAKNASDLLGPIDEVQFELAQGEKAISETKQALKAAKETPRLSVEESVQLKQLLATAKQQLAAAKIHIFAKAEENVA